MGKLVCGASSGNTFYFNIIGPINVSPFSLRIFKMFTPHYFKSRYLTSLNDAEVVEELRKLTYIDKDQGILVGPCDYDGEEGSYQFITNFGQPSSTLQKVFFSEQPKSAQIPQSIEKSESPSSGANQDQSKSQDRTPGRSPSRQEPEKSQREEKCEAETPPLQVPIEIADYPDVLHKKKNKKKPDEPDREKPRER
jgi:hypothetical protein